MDRKGRSGKICYTLTLSSGGVAILLLGGVAPSLSFVSFADNFIAYIFSFSSVSSHAKGNTPQKVIPNIRFISRDREGILC